MEEEQEISKLATEWPHSIELTKGQKGGYGWTAKVRFKEPNPQEMVKVLAEIDAELKKCFKDGAV